MGERGLPDFMLKPEGKRPLGRRWRRCDVDINMDLQAVGWMDLNQDRNGWHGVANVVKNLLVPNSAGNFVTSRGPLSFA
jgi:hypothetical protein